MKKTNLLLLGLCVLNICIFIFGLLLFYWDGYARDNGIYRSQVLEVMIGLVAIICIASLTIGIGKYKGGKSNFLVYNLVFIILESILIGAWINSDGKTMEIPYYSFESRMKATRIEEISLNKLQEVVDSEDDMILYVGRDSCPSCKAFYPKLEELTYDANCFILYYNTEPDRIERKQKMLHTLEVINVFTIPSIVVRIDNQYYVYEEEILNENFEDEFIELLQKK